MSGRLGLTPRVLHREALPCTVLQTTGLTFNAYRLLYTNVDQWVSVCLDYLCTGGFQISEVVGNIYVIIHTPSYPARALQTRSAGKDGMCSYVIWCLAALSVEPVCVCPFDHFPIAPHDPDDCNHEQYVQFKCSFSIT